MPDIDTITLNRAQYKYLWDNLPKWGLAGVVGSRAMINSLGLQEPDTVQFESRYCPDTPKMGLGQKLLWLSVGALALYVTIKIVTK